MANPWRELLTQWNADVFASPVHLGQLPPEIVASGWLGQVGATDQQLYELERRLETHLPNSYKEFLKFTNGWWLALSSVYRLWSVDKIEWLRVRHQEDWIAPWLSNQESVDDDDYFVYGDAQDTVNIRPEYLATSLEISEVFDGALFLLNPIITTPDGEWEGWFMANWMAGARRFQSFWELMKGHYETFIKQRNI